MAKQPKLPPSTVIIRGGQVVKVQNWVLWNGQSWPTIAIEREDGGSFFADTSDPEHGGRAARGTLQHVLTGLHPSIQRQYVTLFEFKVPAAEDIACAGFPRHQVLFDHGEECPCCKKRICSCQNPLTSCLACKKCAACCRCHGGPDRQA